MSKRSTSGRRRIPIAKIKNECHRQVTFSKRRGGLFKKASELCTLCGVETAIVVFSSAGKPFSCGHPSVDSVIDRYISKNNLPIPHPTENHRNDGLCDLNLQITRVLTDLEAEKKKGMEIQNIRKANQVGYWWESPVEEMNWNELEQLEVALEDLKLNLKKQVNQTKQALKMTPFLEGKGGVYSTFDRNMNCLNPNQINFDSGNSSNCNFAYRPNFMFDSRV